MSFNQSVLHRHGIIVLVIMIMVLFQRCQTSSISATQTIQIGDQLNNNNQYEEAIKYYEQYLSSAPSLGVYRNYELESEVLRKLAHAHSTQGRYQTSLEYLRRALKMDREINKNQLFIIEDLRQLGTVYGYIGDYRQATELLNQSLTLTDGMENSVKDSRKLAVADTYLAVGYNQLVLGNYDSALIEIDRAINVYQSMNDEKVGMMEALLMKSNIYVSLNRLDEGVSLAEQSKALAESNDFRSTRQLQTIAEAQKLQGELEQSLVLQQEALEQAEETNIIPQIIWAKLRVGDAYGELGDQEKAQQLYREALELQQSNSLDTSALQPSIQMRLGQIEQARNYWSQSGSSLGTAIANLKIGESLVEDGQLESSYGYFDEAEKLFSVKPAIVEGQAKAQVGKSHWLISNNQSERALQVLNEARQLSIQADTQWQIWFQKGKAFEASTASDSALNAYLKAIDIIEDVRGSLTVEEFKSNYFNDKTIVYDRLISLLLQRGGRLNYDNQDMEAGQLAFIINEKARSRTFLDMLGNRRINHKSESDALLLEREQLLRLKLQQLSQQLQRSELNNQDQLGLQQELEATQSAYQQHLEQVKLSSSHYQSIMTIEPPALNKIQSSLNGNTALIEYWIGQSATVAWVIDQNKIVTIELPGTRTDLARYVEGLRNAIKFNVPEQTEVALTALNQQLIAPLKTHIEGFENIGIIPHGVLHFLPFQALTDEDGNYLIADKNLFYAPSAAVFHYAQNKPPSTQQAVLSLALGDHTIGDYHPLPGTEYEVNQIGQFYDQYTPRYRDKSTESIFKADAGAYNAIHIATHGILSDKQPMYSYLLMSPSEEDDGRLTVHEIMDLNLDASLVTLSACETALGDLNSGDELVGLSRAFLYAGTSAVIVSLWTVDDISTSILMTKFHQFLNEGNQPAVALSMAQRELLKKEFQLSDSRGQSLQWDTSIQKVISSSNQYNKSPYYWAPFILIGSY